MKKVLIIGSGKSSTIMVKYLSNNSERLNIKVTIGSSNFEKLRKKFIDCPNLELVELNVNNEIELENKIKENDYIISYVPAFMHPIVAKYCLKHRKHMLTASYVSKEIREMEREIKENGLIFLNELGVDPGIDHMSAMRIINRIKSEGGVLEAFYSNTGGLIAPENDNNPWHYKFTWNPRNVILAGQGGPAKYKENGKIKYIPYTQLFKRTFRTTVLNYGEFDVYANRDSLIYESLYSIEGIPTLFRGTFRKPPFCQVWNIFVQLGLTENNYIIDNLDKLTFRDFLNMFLPDINSLTPEEKICKIFNLSVDSSEFHALKFSGIFDNNLIPLKEGTPAQVIQLLLEDKLKLEPGDKDMIVMQHIFKYTINNKKKELKSSLVVIGKDEVNTAMALTVGMPTAYALELLLTGKFNKPGVYIPVIPELYEPILNKLESELNIMFIEEEKDL